jgi:hypothetical protein
MASDELTSRAHAVEVRIGDIVKTGFKHLRCATQISSNIIYEARPNIYTGK